MPTMTVWDFAGGAAGAGFPPPPRVIATAVPTGAAVDSCLRSTGARVDTVGGCTAPGAARAPGALSQCISGGGGETERG